MQQVRYFRYATLLSTARLDLNKYKNQSLVTFNSNRLGK
jgi:hypothetical protein